MLESIGRALADLKMYGRFAWGLRGFYREAISIDEARAVVERRLAQREASFLRLLEHGIYGYPKSPYLPLLRLAGCELGDVCNLLRQRGLEGALRALREAGVYVSFEEFKGRTPIVRGGRTFVVRAEDFDNPHLRRAYEVQSGGSTGAGTRSGIDLEHLAERAPYMVLAANAYGVLDAPTVLWRDILPSNTGIGITLANAKFGNVPRKWFTPLVSRDLRPALKYRLATWLFVSMSRMYGVPVPWPERLGLDEAGAVARWAARAIEAEGACAVRATVSLALRVSIAAREAGLDLSGATFWGGGEPPTAAKVRAITACGARWIPSYFFSEAGHIGTGCARPQDGNDLHFFKDGMALIQHPRQVPGSNVTVPAFHFTGLLPGVPKVLLNVESDDYGLVEDRQCGCPLGELGLTDHLREVRSFRKLTGEGVTLVGSEMVQILEEVLPARFGGSPLDYQLVEEEDDLGFTRLSLRVRPSVGLSEGDEAAVVATVLEALGRGSTAADLARATWAQAGTLRVRREAPVWTARAKLLPLHLHRVGGPRPGATAASAGQNRDTEFVDR